MLALNGIYANRGQPLHLRASVAMVSGGLSPSRACVEWVLALDSFRLRREYGLIDPSGNVDTQRRSSDAPRKEVSMSKYRVQTEVQRGVQA